MNRFASVLLLAASLALTARAAELVKAKNGSGVYGYKDTPKLPWCEWLVHDPDRPAPPKVDPGPAGPPVPPPALHPVATSMLETTTMANRIEAIRPSLAHALADLFVTLILRPYLISAIHG